MGSQLHLLLHPVLVLVWILCGAADAVTQPNSNCTKRCGSLEIPFPFGTDESCSLDSSFLISCNHTSTPYLTHNNSTVLSISPDGEMRVSAAVARGCYEVNGTRINETSYDKIFNLTHFSFSSSKNKLTVVGCNTIGEVVGYNVIERRNYATGCFSVCLSVNETTSGICTGAGCCQSPIPASGLSDIGIGSYSSGADSYNAVFGNINPCGYAFVAEDGVYNFSSADLVNFRHQSFPVVVDWAVGNQTCEEAQKNTSSYACRADKSECYNSTKGLGYVCKCSTGFGGNPYLVGGCQDVDECMNKEWNDCYSRAICKNVAGNYTCSCPKGYHGDGRENGTKCRRQSRTQFILIIALGVSVGVIALLVTSFYVYWRMKEKRLNKLKEQFFQQNGGFILLQKISRHRGSKETAKLFTVEELKTATNNFDESKILGKGGQGTVYKGLLSDNRTVAIKRSKISGSTQIEQFINEVVLLSQINHRNVVRLLGCCLETEVPLLVYEFIPNGTIFEHLHGHNINNPQSLKLSWKTRLRIAIETAGALAYLHSAISIPIIHRDIKTTNILLDANLTAKISDFGASKIVPLDQTELTTLVQGTLGYLDPEYMHTSQLTEKSDVYSFGVVLAELLTGKKALSFAVSPEVRNLAVYFVSSMEEGCLVQIVDEHIINEANLRILWNLPMLLNSV
ncbi:wall-associated receptor kinase 3-like [Arachis duranensis]|uniref:Wall-associated receptor kinase 3-like n=1 Tax=Arachis duranensis TaxID=130453 RepID=A0A9C6TJM1_ARADU|nr:wall-associated receptor kinase 3-like [Arachis duranensis]